MRRILIAIAVLACSAATASAQQYVHGQRIGNQTFYSGNNGFSGHSTQIGNQTFYHFNNGVNGYSQNIGNQSFYHDNRGNGWSWGW